MIGADSRYETCVLYVGGDQGINGAMQRIDTTPQPDDVFHAVVKGDRIDLIAYRYLGRAELWWIVCDYNDIFFPLDLELGRMLRLPSEEQVEMRILG